MREKVAKRMEFGDERKSEEKETEAIGREGEKNGDDYRECSRKVKEKRKGKKCKR